MEKSEITIDIVKNYLIKNGIHPSHQRLKIFQYLAKSTEHPTVDMMYHTLCREIGPKAPLASQRLGGIKSFLILL